MLLSTFMTAINYKQEPSKIIVEIFCSAPFKQFAISTLFFNKAQIEIVS